jgi:hypothetical protein
LELRPETAGRLILKDGSLHEGGDIQFALKTSMTSSINLLLRHTPKMVLGHHGMVLVVSVATIISGLHQMAPSKAAISLLMLLRQLVAVRQASNIKMIGRRTLIKGTRHLLHG